MRDMVQVRRPRVNQFLDEPNVRLGRSQFDRSHGLKTTFDASELIPILVDEVLPGDTKTCKVEGFCRIFSPLDAPIMDNIELETFFFFVPNRLIWSSWEYFMGAHDDAGAQDTDYTIPTYQAGVTVSHVGSGQDKFLAYMGLPNGLNTTNVDVNVLPCRAYYLIYNEWFRDQNLIDRTSEAKGDSDSVNYYIKKTAKKHDYFTSALPYLQKGDAVTVGLSGEAPVLGLGPDTHTDTSGPKTIYQSDGTSLVMANYFDNTDLYADSDGEATAYPNIYADLSSATGVSINALRESVAIQRLLEKDARGGTRYVEMIKAHFGVTSPDYRLQRPEFLGGGKSYINVSPVANTSATATENQGQLKGIGSGSMSGHGFAKSFTEHGYVIGLVRARGDISYFQGLDKMWSRSTRYDFYLPELANLGEQAILNKEIFVSNSAATDDAAFGYQERWAEYRFKRSLITGKFNPDVAGSLSFWHLAEDFSSLPSLNSTFIEDQTPMARVTTVDTEPDFLLDVWFNYKEARVMPVHSIPSLTSGRF